MMFGIGIRYLNGWAMAAADGARKERAEWPPHPDRVFMALAAGWFETGRDEAEEAALRWLEQRPTPPAIAASEAEYRVASGDHRPPTHFVPVNDPALSRGNTVDKLVVQSGTTLAALKNAGLSQVVEFRSRQPRAYPVAIPHRDTVHLIWDHPLDEAHRDGLICLCRKAVYLGHSASLVQMWLDESPPTPDWVPSQGVAPHRLRLFGPGRLDYLDRRLNRAAWIDYHDRQAVIAVDKKKRTALKVEQAARHPDGPPISLRPEPGLWQGYAAPLSIKEPPPAGSIFDPRPLVLTLSGKRLDLPATLKLIQALRGALFKHFADRPIPEWISGHAADGTPSRHPHIAFLPLPFVGALHADGHILGVGLAIPKTIDPSEVEQTLGSWLRDERGELKAVRLFDRQWLECHAELEARPRPPFNLQSETWTQPSQCWASVTPVVLDRHFDGSRRWEKAAESIKAGCERVGLPRPSEVLLDPISRVAGVPHSNQFPWIERKRGGGRMQHSHAVLLFDQPVQGPILVGAGRFRGYGLFRPMTQGGSTHV
ncbi:MAG: type I-U CRISPR-associated protein Cas5/Cas6 [Alphaproteobacteria bacterium CG_4_10_14_0_2_um_filter_63_37]|nr:MAG: type I-U CRISPR-associated protein Cas5/Cas6 [Alphaproteobacteria bacterium CG_4_10_14_0_2_um_filter_63_37]